MPLFRIRNVLTIYCGEGTIVDYAVIDFETTGSVRGWPVEPWQVGLVYVRNGRVALNGGIDSLIRINRERPFNPLAPGRHAELRDKLALAPTATDLLPQLIATTEGLTLVAHNTGTERKMLAKMAPLHPWGPWIDTLPLARRFLPDLDDYGLESVIRQLDLSARVQNLCPGRVAHDAYYDAVACAVMLEHFLSR